MLRLAIAVCVLAGLVWFGGVYKLGDKTLASHLDEIYRSPLVQKKLDALHKGFDEKLDDFALERSKQDTTKRRVQARLQPHESDRTPVKRASPMAAPEPETQDVRPNKVKKTPPRDSLTDDDREDLDKLLADKLH